MLSYKACLRKVKYTKSEAEFQVRVRGGQGSCYHCNHCRQWHVTRQPVNHIRDKVWNEIRWQRLREKLPRRITQTLHDEIATDLEKRQQELNDRLKLLTNDNKQFQVTFLI